MAEIEPSATVRACHPSRRDLPVSSLANVAWTRSARPLSDATPRRWSLPGVTSGRQRISPLAAPGPQSPQSLQKSLPARLNPAVAHESPSPAATASCRAGGSRATVTHRSGSTRVIFARPLARQSMLSRLAGCISRHGRQSRRPTLAAGWEPAISSRRAGMQRARAEAGARAQVAGASGQVPERNTPARWVIILERRHGTDVAESFQSPTLGRSGRNGLGARAHARSGWCGVVLARVAPT